MISILTLLIIVWFMIFTASRFLQYYRIVTEYKNTTMAKVLEVSDHPIKNKKQKPAVDVVMQYEIDGNEGKSEIIVPADLGGQYEVGKEFKICYKIDPNGTVHIASWSPANKKIMIGHAAAIAVEFAAFVILWWSML
ncbi:MAG: hypothetical protein MJ117_03765 [Lachnospiraceae bacterium]|nr:hypothetical protein [Lachnospiraceae bacterium]